MSLSPAPVARVAAALPALVEEVRAASARPRPLVVAGPPALVAELARGLAWGGDPSLVRELPVAALRDDTLAGVAVLVYVVRGEVTATDERVLGTAAWHRVPVVCAVLGDGSAYRALLPVVPATAIVRLFEIDDAAIATVAECVSRRAPDAVWPLASKLPAVRAHSAGGLVRAHARSSAVLELAPLSAGRYPPVLSQARMVLRLAAANGVDPGRAALPAVVGAACAGLGVRMLAGRLAGRSGLVARLAAAYVGTRMLGAAATALSERAGAGGGR